MDINSVDSVLSAYQAASSKNTSKSQPGDLDMNDFFQLMAAQLKYQDPLEQTDNSQYMAQMAQFSLLAAVQSLAKTLNFSSSGSVVGKSIIYTAPDSLGQTVTRTGVIDAVDLTSSEPVCYVNGEWVPLSSVSVIYDMPESANPPQV